MELFIYQTMTRVTFPSFLSGLCHYQLQKLMYEITFPITMQLQQRWLVPLLAHFPVFPKTKTKKYIPGWGVVWDDCNLNQFLSAIVIDNCSYCCGFDGVALCTNSNACHKWIYLIVLHTHTYAGTEKRGNTPLDFPLSSWHSVAQFSVQELLCCWCSAVWHWANRAELPTAAPPPRQCGKARRHAGLGSKCCQRRWRQSVPRLFVDCLFLFFSGNSRERAKGTSRRGRRGASLRWERA